MSLKHHHHRGGGEVSGSKSFVRQFNICKAVASVCSAVDVISAIQFDNSGDHLATGDRGGRVVLSEITDVKNSMEQEGMKKQVHASEEAASGELEASLEFSSSVYVSNNVLNSFQCPVCYSPASTRCSRCLVADNVNVES
ncbi:serine/threonine-protein phosphatase 2A 55 kDa regulatory subunit B delta isoform-like [Raphanus sativus]|uniref:Uncharacterized protein LOC108810080 n=1 Tax=Raphanus sativus TaxID=3726 RepID=A0A6J0JQR2_RAPSA|nr:uncharacterized protein LOC108810080 [Raphanus sativus]KAJ4889089.1 serine/threonine-protein phosphatase 2A 55 kDa regulatory subunit B delta isoform-like [Raphanus sativus]